MYNIPKKYRHPLFQKVSVKSGDVVMAPVCVFEEFKASLNPSEQFSWRALLEAGFVNLMHFGTPVVRSEERSEMTIVPMSALLPKLPVEDGDA